MIQSEERSRRDAEWLGERGTESVVDAETILLQVAFQAWMATRGMRLL